MIIELASNILHEILDVVARTEPWDFPPSINTDIENFYLNDALRRVLQRNVTSVVYRADIQRYEIECDDKKYQKQYGNIKYYYENNNKKSKNRNTNSSIK